MFTDLRMFDKAKVCPFLNYAFAVFALCVLAYLHKKKVCCLNIRSRCLCTCLSLNFHNLIDFCSPSIMCGSLRSSKFSWYIGKQTQTIHHCSMHCWISANLQSSRKRSWITSKIHQRIFQRSSLEALAAYRLETFPVDGENLLLICPARFCYYKIIFLFWNTQKSVLSQESLSLPVLHRNQCVFWIRLACWLDGSKAA